MNKSNHTVLIAGAGPVGMTTGLTLAKAGIPVKVFDSLAEIPTDHRASTLHPSTLMMIEELGMTDILIGRGIKSPLFQFRDRVSGDIVAEFDYGLISDQLKFPYALQVEQHKTIEVARDLALKHNNFELYRERELMTFSQDDNGVEVMVEGRDGEKEVHTGAFLIGADGGKSVVRKILDIDFPGFTWEERFIIVSTYLDCRIDLFFCKSATTSIRKPDNQRPIPK